MFRFTIRDVLWLTVVVAMGAGWWFEHARVRNALLEWHVSYAANGWREAEKLEAEVARLRSELEKYKAGGPDTPNGITLP
jgi:hypothetical protein